MFQLISILNLYSKESGQKINLLKSCLIGVKFMSLALKSKLASILSIQVWDNLGKQLGLPADWGRAKINELAWIKERIYSKVEGWKENLLNQAEKEVLIKAMIQTIQTYTMSMVQFPKNSCRSICANIARFWWHGNGKFRGIHWRKWDLLTKNKNEGGMDFRDFNALNSGLLAKQAWQLIQNPTALWASILKRIYFPNFGFSSCNKEEKGFLGLGQFASWERYYQEGRKMGDRGWSEY